MLINVKNSAKVIPKIAKKTPTSDAMLTFSPKKTAIAGTAGYGAYALGRKSPTKPGNRAVDKHPMGGYSSYGQ